jgi:hypothetical protein
MKIYRSHIKENATPEEEAAWFVAIEAKIKEAERSGILVS